MHSIENKNQYQKGGTLLLETPDSRKTNFQYDLRG